MSEIKISDTAISPYQGLSSQGIQIQEVIGLSDMVKVYINNVFAGIAKVEKEKGEIKIPQSQIDSIKVLTSKTEDELLKVFESVVNLEGGPHKQEIHEKFSSILFFIQQYTQNPRLKPLITKCDVDNLLEQIGRLEKIATRPEIKSTLIKYREIISAFKIDKVLCHGPLDRNNDYNIRYYNDKSRDGLNTYANLQTIIAKTEEGPLVTQLADLCKTGKIMKEDGLNLNQLNHGDLVCFETLRGKSFGEKAITFAVVDKLGDDTKLRIPGNEKTYLFQPQDQIVFSRIQLPVS